MKHISAIWAAVAVLIVTVSTASATPVLSGYDLLETVAGTHFGGIPFNGVPLGTFNFGGTIGIQGVGTTDTIIHRLADANPAIPGSASVPTELSALQLVSAVPVDFGLGLDFYYMTLQSARGGPASVGTMTINFASDSGGTFDSFFDVFFDIRKGALSGPIALSDSLDAAESGAPWGRFPPPGSILIDGANFDLNGSDSSADFFAQGFFTQTYPTGAQHVLEEASVPVPEPGTLTIFGLGLVGLFTVRRRRTS